MPLTLPVPRDEPLGGSPLALVVFQLRFSSERSLGPLAAAQFASRLATEGYDFPKADPIQTLTVNLTASNLATAPPPTIASTATQGGWRLQTSDASWVITLSSEAVSLETTRYGDWHNDFRKRLHAVLKCVAVEIEPSVELRLGLRFVDIINKPVVRSPREWKGRIADWLLAPALHEGIGSALTSFQQQYNIDVGNGVRATVRNGAYPDAARSNALTYLLDCDIFRDQLKPFDAAGVQAAADEFHTTALALFQAMITSAFYEELKASE